MRFHDMKCQQDIDGVIVQELMKAVERGACPRRKIGAVIADRNLNVLGVGHNGPASGTCNCPAKDVPAGTGGADTECYAVHAETRALLDAGDNLCKANVIFTNKAPCRQCTINLLTTEIQKIFFLTPSRETKNKELWESAGRKWIQVNTENA